MPSLHEPVVITAIDRIARARVVPVLVVDDPASAQPLGEALAAGGLPLAEVTFRTAHAESVLRTLAANPDLCVGAGTVVTADQVDVAVDAGARFIVSPGLSADVVRRARALSTPVIPGIATATELMQALDLGVDVVKLFPANVVGGLPAVSALAGPFPQVRFIPTGGIRAADAATYLAHPSVLAVGGSWMTPPSLVRAAEWEQITRLVRVAVSAVDPGAVRA